MTAEGFVLGIELVAGAVLDDVAHINSVLEGLNTERNILEKIGTWPWRTETLTGFLSVIVLPIVLFLIQLAIQKWLNL